MNGSLLQTDRQMELTTADAPAERFAAAESNGDYTGERLFAHRRHDYDLIVRMLREGMSAISISRIMQCAEKTVAAVRDRELAHLKVPDVKIAMGARWGQTFHLAQDIMQEIAEDPTRRKKVSFKDAAIAASIATQNHQLLHGEATGRVEIVAQESGHNELNDYLAQLRAVPVAGELAPVPAAPALPAASPPEAKDPAALAGDGVAVPVVVEV